MYTKPGPWYLFLRGTPCASCGQPAERLTVFAGERVITHREEDQPPCQLPNPPQPAATQPIEIPQVRRPAA
jgi:hypothetical protein